MGSGKGGMDGITARSRIHVFKLRANMSSADRNMFGLTHPVLVWSALGLHMVMVVVQYMSLLQMRPDIPPFWRDFFYWTLIIYAFGWLVYLADVASKLDQKQPTGEEKLA